MQRAWSGVRPGRAEWPLHCLSSTRADSIWADVKTASRCLGLLDAAGGGGRPGRGARRRRRAVSSAVSVPAAGFAGQGEHRGPGEEVAGQGDDLAPDLVLGVAVQGQVPQAGVLGAASACSGRSSAGPRRRSATPAPLTGGPGSSSPATPSSGLPGRRPLICAARGNGQPSRAGSPRPGSAGDFGTSARRPHVRPVRRNLASPVPGGRPARRTAARRPATTSARTPNRTR